MPSIKVCGTCHTHQAKRFTMGKHGKAETALSISTMGKKVKAHAPGIFDKSCATCHNGICKDGGQCNACHGSHRFSAREARKPEACLPCHMGNHPQYEAYGNSRHGALYRSRGLDGNVPTCATCPYARRRPHGQNQLGLFWGSGGRARSTAFCCPEHRQRGRGDARSDSGPGQFQAQYGPMDRT